VIVKRGADGAVLMTRGGSHRLRAIRTTVVDPTGAGDALAGAVMGRLVQRGHRLDQDSLVDALEWGLVAASFTVEKPGIAGIRDCTLDEMKARLEAYRLEVRPGEPRQA
jgi:sugar/nucleoside kinase (ribokinase family)